MCVLIRKGKPVFSVWYLALWNAKGSGNMEREKEWYIIINPGIVEVMYRRLVLNRHDSAWFAVLLSYSCPEKKDVYSTWAARHVSTGWELRWKLWQIQTAALTKSWWFVSPTHGVHLYLKVHEDVPEFQHCKITDCSLLQTCYFCYYYCYYYYY
jgi:hypothetical protein